MKKIKLLEDFKAFVMRGNVIDMAVGIIIGAAFTKIVSSLVADVLTPPLGLLLGGVDFSDLSITLKQATADLPAVVLGYGKFIQTMVDFLIISFAVFGLVKLSTRLDHHKKDQAAAAPAPPTKEEELLSEIRDLLKNK